MVINRAGPGNDYDAALLVQGPFRLPRVFTACKVRTTEAWRLAWGPRFLPLKTLTACKARAADAGRQARGARPLRRLHLARAAPRQVLLEGPRPPLLVQGPPRLLPGPPALINRGGAAINRLY